MSPLDDLTAPACTRPFTSGRDLRTNPALLRELAETLDGSGSPRMALAFREAADAVSRAPACGPKQGRP
jgi:hypothetical protein